MSRQRPGTGKSGLQHCILTQKANAINSVVSGWEALVECGVILTISMKPGFYRRVNIVLGTEIKTNVKTDRLGLMLTKDNDITFICQRLLHHQRLRHGHTTLNDTIMPFATAFFDSDNTTVVLTKDYIILTVKGIISSCLMMMIVWCTRTHGNGQRCCQR